MYELFNYVGYAAYITDLRRGYPEPSTLEQYLCGYGWESVGSSA